MWDDQVGMNLLKIWIPRPFLILLFIFKNFFFFGLDMNFFENTHVI